jgi:ribosomal protein L10
MNLKNFKTNKLKHLLKTKKLLYICSYKMTKTKDWKLLEQIFIKHDLKYYKISNNILIKVLQKSVFKTMIPLINGPIVLLYSNKVPKNFNYTQLKKILNLKIEILCGRLCNKLYSEAQLKHTFIQYNLSVTLLNKLFKNLQKQSLFKLKKISIKT